MVVPQDTFSSRLRRLYPGVQAFVDEILLAGNYRKVALVNSMFVIQKLGNSLTKFKDFT